MSTYRNVKAQIAKLEKQAADLLKKEVAVVIAKVRGLIAEYGLTAADLGLTGKVNKAVKGQSKTTAKPVGIPMYADPVSGKTWTGKGKQPNWIIEGLKKGKSKADYLISKAATAPVAPAKVSKPVKTAKVAQAAKAAKKPAPVSKPAKKVTLKTAVKKVSAKAVAVKAEVAKG
jgi:DNA-binding protein H-NS